uniref:Beta-galactosidase n=1 Tax=Romanomermis culicivorax TaxID=13658 RepID=A0A915HT96_ROMCU
NWNKGVAFVNGFNLGRYWKVGPQKALYVPAPILSGSLRNEVLMFELHQPTVPTAIFQADPKLDFTEQNKLVKPSQTQAQPRLFMVRAGLGQGPPMQDPIMNRQFVASI